MMKLESFQIKRLDFTKEIKSQIDSEEEGRNENFNI